MEMDQREGFMYMDGYDDCILAHGFQFNNPIVIYSYNLVIQKNMSMGMDYEGAVEYFDFNQAGAFVGDQTPVFVDDNVATSKEIAKMQKIFSRS